MASRRLRESGPTSSVHQSAAYQLGNLPTDNVFPRPRDLIVLTKASMEAAVNRGDPRIEERDLLAGIRQYSAFAYNALVVEGKSQFPKIEDVLFQLMEGPDVLSEYQLLEVLERVSPEYDVERFIEFLADLTFLGFEVRRGEFSFIHDFVDRTKVEVRAKKVAEEYKERRYKRFTSAFLKSSWNSDQIQNEEKRGRWIEQSRNRTFVSRTTRIIRPQTGRQNGAPCAQPQSRHRSRPRRVDRHQAPSRSPMTGAAIPEQHQSQPHGC